MSENKQISNGENQNDELHFGLKALSFCLPFVGGILYFSNKNTYPNKAKSACHAALWGGAINLIISIAERVSK